MRPATGDAARSGPGASPAEELPVPARRAARRAGLADTATTLLVGFGPGGGGSETREIGGVEATVTAAWTDRRHLIVRCGGRLGPGAAVERLTAAGVSAETPALVAAGLGTARERLLYGSLEDAARAGFEGHSVLVVPHPAALPVDFAWPPTAAP